MIRDENASVTRVPFFYLWITGCLSRSYPQAQSKSDGKRDKGYLPTRTYKNAKLLLKFVQRDRA